MRQQHEILRSAPLLNASGDLAEPGWARSLLPVYRRSDIRVSPMRIKEWDYYLITDGHVGLALTIADNGYMGLDSVSFLDFDEGWEQTKSPMRLFPMGKTGLPESSADGASEIARGGYAMAFYHEDGARRLSFHMDRFLDGDAIEGIVTLSAAPEESMVIATPFEKPGHFYYNQKINCMRAEGWITLGKRRIELTPDRFYTLAVQLKSNSKFKIGADNTVLYHIALNPLFTDRSKWILVACSSWYTGRGPELTIDGDVSTKFENRYNDIGQGDIETLPVTIDWDLGKTCYYAGMKLTRRNDSYVTDLKAGWIEMSDDGKTWTPLQSFDFEGSKTVVGDFRSEQWFGAGRYLRLKMTESGRPGRNERKSGLHPVGTGIP